MSTTKRRLARAPLAALRAAACAALLLLALPNATRSQQQQQPQQRPDEDVVKIDSALMQAGVSVFDKQGRFVGGLQAEQFEVMGDGKPTSASLF